MTYVSRTEQDTKKIAAEFAGTLRGGELIFLYGDLGSGKTTFVRGVAEAMGFHQPVRSPSFTLVNRYKVSSNNIKEIIHVDLYRLESSDELRALALEEELGRKDAVVFIEWPERAQGLLGEPTRTVEFAIDGNSRSIILQQREALHQQT